MIVAAVCTTKKSPHASEPVSKSEFFGVTIETYACSDFNDSKS